MEKYKELLEKIKAKGFDFYQAIKEHNRLTQDISITDYIQSKRRNLEAIYQSYIPIYLDTKYWIYFRDVRLGRPISKDIVLLYNLFKLKIDSKLIFCPISTTTFFEIMRQSDEMTRNETCKLIDEFSKRICLRFFDDRITDEFIYFLLKITQQENLYCLTNYDFIGHIIGIPYVKIELPSKNYNTASVTKSLYDLFEYLSLYDIQDIIGFNKQNYLDEQVSMNITTEELNKLKLTKLGKTYSQLYLEELFGSLRLYKKQICKAFKIVYCLQNNISFSNMPSQDVDDKQYELFCNIILHLFKEKKQHKKDLQLIHINASIHSAILIDHKRKYKNTDYDDIMHTSIALPVCKYFLTENSLCHLIKSPPTELSKYFNISISSSIVDSINFISQIT
jgi:hypothetical protein